MKRNTGFSVTIVLIFVLFGSIWGVAADQKNNPNSGTPGTSVVQGTEQYYKNFYGLDAGTLSTGIDNAFMGKSAGKLNTGDCSCIFGSMDGATGTFGHFNTFIGCNAGYSISTGYDHTFIGYNAGKANTEGHDSVFVGYDSGYGDIAERQNTYFGALTGVSAVTGKFNIFIGTYSGYYNTSGEKNTVIGYYAAFKNNTGSQNTLIGKYSGGIITSGSRNTFLGYATGYSNSVGEGNVFLGYQAGYYEFGSNKLYIANSTTSTPLIYGDFAASKLRVNSSLGIGVIPDTHPLQMANLAYCSAGGVWTNASSRSLKENIQALASQEALDALDQLAPVKYNYKVDKRDSHLGFIAEDVPALVATADRKGLSPMDIAAVLTGVVREEKRLIRDQQARIRKQQEMIEAQQKMISDLQEKMAEIENYRGK
ncbi:MAG: tail fiber domain-containing protein [Candidatus Omnitrophota bacterium]